MKASGDRLALVDTEGKWSYRALLSGADKLVAESAASPRIAASGNGTATQQRIAYLCPRDVTYVISMLATWRMGAIAVPLPDSHPVDELQYFLEDSTPCQLLATEKHRDITRELSSRTSVPVHWVQPPGSLSLLTRSQQGASGSSIDASRGMAASSAAAPTDAAAGAMIIYTSGTTNRP
jgi:acyl-CoA synthetase (AMP-forming)/AMP-acid ligase II